MHFTHTAKLAVMVGAWFAGLALAQTASVPLTSPSDAAGTSAAATSARPSANALTVLTPAPPYDASDDAARQPTMQELGLRGHIELAQMRERADRKPRDWRLQALVGQMEHLGGDRAAAEARYQRAVDAAGKNEVRLRHVLWSRGWARLYSGDNEGALLDWRDAAKLHGGKPRWYPYTVALAYWRADARPVGMQWFEASELSKRAAGKQNLAGEGLPPLATSLLFDMFEVRDLRSNSSTRRIAAGAPAVQAPAYLMAPTPEFHRAALPARANGEVLLLICVDSRGQPQAFRVIRSSGRSDLDRAATKLMAASRFRPASCGGRPRDSWVASPISFQTSRVDRAPPPPDAAFARIECVRDVALDPDGYTAVTDSCETDVVCAPDSVPEPDSCVLSSSP